MSERWHFKSPKYISEGRPLDTNIDHYKNGSRDFVRLDKKLIQEHNPKKYSRYHKNFDYVMGVAIKFVDGSIFKTKDYTVNDINEVIHGDYDKWLKLKNGGELCLDRVISYLPWKFYNRERG